MGTDRRTQGVAALSGLNGWLPCPIGCDDDEGWRKLKTRVMGTARKSCHTSAVGSSRSQDLQHCSFPTVRAEHQQSHKTAGISIKEM